MNVSGFTFYRNAQMLGYPIEASIRSILPLVDEFVVALGPCADNTEDVIRSIGDPKIRVIHTTWNESIRNDLKIKGFVYGQQKSIALFNCTGDWAFYLEGDEVLHENDLPAIRASMERHLDDRRVEALVFDYIHFYGNGNTYAWSPGWYRRAPRVIRNNLTAWAPKGLFFIVMDSQKRGRYPRAALADGRIFHYGWARGEARIQANKDQIEKYWGKVSKPLDLRAIDARVLRRFEGTHPAVMKDWLGDEQGLFEADPNHVLTRREKKHRRMMVVERALGLCFNKKHYTLVR